MREFGQYLEVGLSPIPLKEKEKRPAFIAWQQYCNAAPDADTVRFWESNYDLDHIGLCLGTKISDDYQLIAIDVDSEDLIDLVWGAIGDPSAPAKKGQKGITIFAKAKSNVVNQKIKRKMPDGKAAKAPSVEILCHGTQTVVPPATHPVTQKPYFWTTRSLLDGFPGNLVAFDEWTADELVAICQGKGETFHALNTMERSTKNDAGNAHNTAVVAVALLVSRNWPDSAIHRRIARAYNESSARSSVEYNEARHAKTIQEWIDSAREKGMTDTSKTKIKIPLERQMADWCIEKLGGIARVATVDGVLRSYRDGHWPRVDIGDLSRAMFAHAHNLTDRERKSSLSILHTVTERLNFGITPGVVAKYDTKRQRVCMKNGTVEVLNGTLVPHAPEHELLHQLDFAWDDAAECPVFDDFMRHIQPDPRRRALCEEYLALIFIDDMSFQKMMFWQGGGANGKGTLARIFRSMLDPDAIGSVSITDLNDERKRTSLVGKKVNISGEQARFRVIDDGYLKKITGEDPIDTRRLYGETNNNVLLQCRFLEMVNAMPSTQDTSDAFKRRAIIVPFEVTITNPDPGIEKRMHDERPGIFRRFVARLGDLYSRGYFDVPPECTAALDDYLLENDPVKRWVQERCEEIPEGQHGTPTRELYADFYEWAKMSGHRWILTDVQWGKELIRFPTRVDSKLKVRTRQLKIRSGLSIPI